MRKSCPIVIDHTEAAIRYYDELMGADPTDSEIVFVSFAARANLGRAYEGEGRATEALAVYRRMIALWNGRSGAEPPQLSVARQRLAVLSPK